MSKVPQRGEIWKSEDEYLYIVSVHCGIVFYVYVKNRKAYTESMRYSAFRKIYNYLGNSKIDVEELFDVAED